MVNLATTLTLTMVIKLLSSLSISSRSVRQTRLTGTRSPREAWNVLRRSKHTKFSFFLFFDLLEAYVNLIMYVISFALLKLGTHGRFIRRDYWPWPECMASGSTFPTLTAVRAVVTLRCFMLLSTASWYFLNGHFVLEF